MKAQEEIFGLVFFVILVIIFFTIYFSLTMHRSIPPVNQESNFYTDVLTSSSLTSLLRTNTCGLSIRDLIINCVTLNNTNCSNGTTSFDACSYIEWFVNNSLSPIFKGYNYEFIVLKDSTPFIVLNSSCTNSRISPSMQVYSLWPMHGNVVIKLSIC